MFKFAQHGQCGTWVSELLPHIGTHRRRHRHRQVDQHRGDQPRPGHHLHPDRQPAAGPAEPGRVAQLRPRQREREPARVRRDDLAGQRQQDRPADLLAAVGQRLPAHRSTRASASARGDDPVLYLSNPPGIDRDPPRRCSTASASSTSWPPQAFGDPEINTRIAQYEMAFRMQTVGARADRPLERAEDTSRHVRPRRRRRRRRLRPQLPAGPPAGRARRALRAALSTAAGTSTATCRRRSAASARTSTSRSAALIKDLKQRGLLDDTLVIWGGEFGRTVYSQGALTEDNYGRDHHGRCFTHVAGRRRHQAGHHATARPTTTATTSSRTRSTSTTCNATILHCLGIDHTRLTYRFQGRDFRLTDVHGNVVEPILA